MDWIVGSDEVGYGALAGPLFVVAVAAPRVWSLEGLKDSKKYSSRQHRERLYEPLCDAIRGRWALATRTNEEIDAQGVYPCLLSAHKEALKAASRLARGPISLVIVDGSLTIPGMPKVHAVPKADSKFQVVSAASVMAKLLRDQEMELHGEKYPLYDFGNNVGYGAPRHLEALAAHGPCPLHRHSYLKKLLRRMQDGTP